MTVEEKIKKYRLLKGLTLKELGVAVGFKESTAEVRINQYEVNRTYPKKHIRDILTKSLDISPYAIMKPSTENINNVIHLLFDLEEEYGVSFESYDDNGRVIVEIENIELLDALKQLIQKKREYKLQYSDTKEDIEKKIKEYALWKGRFEIEDD